MIVCAAIKLIRENDSKYIEKGYIVRPDELIVCGLRHGHCIQTIKELDEKWHKATRIQGFINHKGEFLDRKEAFKHAKEIGQYNETQRYYWEDHNQSELYSEDLY